MAVKASVLAAADTNFRALFTRSLNQAAANYRKLCMIVPSTARENVYGWLAALPAVKKVLGEYARKKLQQLGYRLTNEKFGVIVDVSQEDFDDDQLGAYGPAMSSLGERTAFVPDTELTSLMVKGFGNSAAGKDYTGTAFFAANKKAHAKATAFTNVDAGSKKLNAANFEAALANLQERRDAEGVPMYLGLDPSKLYLVVTATDRATAEAIVALKTLAAGGENPNYNKAQVLVWPGLEAEAAAVIGAGARPWMLLDCSKEVKPFIFQERERFTLVSLTDPTAQQVFEQDLYSWKTRGRLAVGFGLPELAYGSAGENAAA